jgi:hypothetical protein
MLHFEASTFLSQPIVTVFGFLLLPANLVEIMSPEFNVRLVHARKPLHSGAPLER